MIATGNHVHFNSLRGVPRQAMRAWQAGNDRQTIGPSRFATTDENPKRAQRKLRSCSCKYVHIFANQDGAEMLLSCCAKKVTKERAIGEALRKCALPYVPHPPLRQPLFKNVPIFEHLPLKILQFFSLQTPENRNIFGCRMAKRRVGYIGEGAFS